MRFVNKQEGGDDLKEKNPWKYITIMYIIKLINILLNQSEVDDIMNRITWHNPVHIESRLLLFVLD